MTIDEIVEALRQIESLLGNVARAVDARANLNLADEIYATENSLQWALRAAHKEQNDG